MAHTLSSHDIALLVGSQSFSRGERYARIGHVLTQSWFGEGTQLFGTVRGSTGTSYAVTVSFTFTASGAVSRTNGVCTCPVKTNCKHVAALLVASQGKPAETSAINHSGSTAGTARTETRIGTARELAFGRADAARDAREALRDEREARDNPERAAERTAWRSTPVFDEAPAPAAPEPVAGWRTALAPLARPTGAERTLGTPLALQLELLAPPRPVRGIPGAPARPFRLGARPMVMGKQGRWIRGSITWDNLSWARGSFNTAQLKAITSLYALYLAGQRYAYSDHWIQLDGFANKALWELLTEAQAAGLPIIGSGRAQTPVVLSPVPASLELDIRRSSAGLELTPFMQLGERRLPGGQFGFMGDPAHGIFSWTSPADAEALLEGAADGTGAASAQGAVIAPSRRPFALEEDLDSMHLTLAPLAGPVSDTLRSLALGGGALSIPPADEAAFLADYYPFLRSQVQVTSLDESFEQPETARPLLALTISHQPDARIALHWQWEYHGEGTDATLQATTDLPATPEPSVGTDPSAATPVALPAALYSHGLRATPLDTNFRDEALEAEIAGSVIGLLAGYPGLSPQLTPAQAPSHAPVPGRIGNRRLASRATLDGVRMIEFLQTVVPQFLASSRLIVNVIGEAPLYREADEAPVISLATTERADSRDWFDLAVTVSIDGEKIPFDDLFRALAGNRDIMILRSGTYFSLNRPELHQLRRLIDEARGLQETPTGPLGISRFQSDLWEELQMLGIVAAQAAAWRDTVAGLAAANAGAGLAEPGEEGASNVPVRALPDGLQATLRSYQQSGFDWLTFLYDHGLGGVLADDMGLGKTLQAIALMLHVRDAQAASQDAASQASASETAHPGTPAPPFLVVAPTSVVSNWATECAKFAPDLRVAVVSETTRKRGGSLVDAIDGADVVITSYTLFRLDFDEFNAQPWAGLLLDEAQFVKNHQSRAHVCARKLNAPFKLAITGTPLENNLMEFWSLLSITAPGLFPSPSRFAEYYQKPIEVEANDERLAQLRRRIRPFMLRRTKNQVASDLPEKQEQVLELDLHPKHRKVYDTHLQRERQKVLGLIEDLNANRFEIFRSLTMLRQLSLDASLYDEKYDNIPSTKLDALLDLLGDTVAEGHRTLIFSQFTRYLGKARERLEAAGISYSYLDGKTRNRAKAIADFKNGDSSVFLISLKAGGFGLNLTEADYVILLDPWWNPATEAQAVDRVHRIGQTKNVLVYRLVAKNTIEEKVMALKAAKAKLFESVMTDGAARGTAFTAADIRELLS